MRIRTTRASDVGDDSLEARIGTRIEPQPNDCWLFRGRADVYGRFVDTRTGRTIVVHRFVYEMLTGITVPRGYHLHHACETPGCCNPDHLRVVDPREHRAAHDRLATLDELFGPNTE